MPFMVKAVGTFTWTMFSVLDLNLISLTVLVTQHHLVLTLMMLASAAIPHVCDTINIYYGNMNDVYIFSCL